MSFHHLLDRVQRIWRWSVVTMVALLYIPPVTAMFLVRSCGINVGMVGLNDHSFEHSEDLSLWFLMMGFICSLATAVIALSAGATYLIGRKLPDYTEIVSPA